MNDRRTPAQIAGLIPSPKTEHEQMLEDIATTVRGADGLTFMERKAAEKLARRRTLLDEATALAEENAKVAEDLEKQRTKVLERLTKAEKEWRAAQEAARGLPLWAPSSPRIGEIHRELISTCDPRLRDLQAWLEREITVTRAYGPSLEFADGALFSTRAGSAGFNQGVLRALEGRLVAIGEALAAVRSAMLEALSDAEIEGKIEEILALVPPIPAAGASHQGPLPAPLTVLGRPPIREVQERGTRIATVGEQYKRAAKSDRRTRK